MVCRYLGTHVLFSSLYIFPLNKLVAREQLHSQTEVNQLQFPGNQEVVTRLDVNMNDIDVVNLSEQNIKSSSRNSGRPYLTASSICSQ